jgi:L-threonylcarbamoyladenylate synthase
MPSPTNAIHVIDDLSGKIDVIIDAGSAKIGLESTVLDMTTHPPIMLRPGGITLEQINEVIGHADIDPMIMSKVTDDFKPRSPGMKYKHYSPRADIVIIEGDPQKVCNKIKELVFEYGKKGKIVGVLATDQTKGLYPFAQVISLGDRDKLETVASNLFWAFREFDNKNVDLIITEAVDYEGIGLAVMNRMKKAAGYNIIKV